MLGSRADGRPTPDHRSGSGGPLLILGARADQLPLFDAAGARGLAVAAIDPDPEAPGLARAGRSLVADLADERACLTFARTVRPAAVVTFAADFPVPMVSRLAEACGRPGLDPAAVAGVTDKLVMRCRLDRAGVAVPAWAVVDPTTPPPTPTDLPVDGSGRAVIKPRRSSGSRGVRAVEVADTVELARAIEAAAGHDDLDGVLIEELIDGPEVSVEAITVDGATTVIAHTAKSTSGSPDFVELAHHQPAGLGPAESAELDDVVTRAVAALGIDDALVHAELRLTDGGPVVMEIAARAGGGAIASDLVRLSTGVDTADLAIALALGERPTARPRWCRGASVRYFQPPVGRLVAIDGIERARAMDGVERIDVGIEPGAVIGSLRDSRQRVGRLIASGPDGRVAAERAAAAVAEIEFRVAA